MKSKGTLFFFCGKMGAGKSTLSYEIALAENAVLISEDEWLKTIYPTEIKNFEDYIKYSSRLKFIIKPHVQNILNSGVPVVMDFPGNTKKQRVWFKEIYTEHGCSHKLIYIEASDSPCIKQIKKEQNLIHNVLNSIPKIFFMRLQVTFSLRLNMRVLILKW